MKASDATATNVTSAAALYLHAFRFALLDITPRPVAAVHR
jgi:hypothetical protein